VRRDLTVRQGSGEKAHSEAAVNKQELEQRIFDIVREDILAVDDSFTRETNLIEAGLDSLALTQLMLAIEETTGVWIDESLLNEESLASVVALTELVHRSLA
jgi:acyl carrier protein